MGGETDADGLAGGDGKLLLDFGQMSVQRDTVGPHALVALGVKVLDFGVAPRTAHPAHAAHLDGFQPKHPRAQQGNQGQKNAGRIAPGAGHQFGVPQLPAVNLHQTVYALVGEGRFGVRGTVKLRVDPGVLDSEICAQVDDA